MGDTHTPTIKKEQVPTSVSCPMLTSSNYTVWAMRMKVTLRVHKVWEAIDPGTKEAEKNDVATALLFQSIPEGLILQVGDQDSPKDIWEAIKSRHLGADRVKEARLQTLISEFDRLKMKDTESIDVFAGKISVLSSRAASLGQVLEEPKLVKRFLNGLPRNKYIHIIASLEQVLDLNKTGFEDIVGRLKAYEERILDDEGHAEPQGNLLFTHSDSHKNRGGSGTGQELFQHENRASYDYSQGQGRGRGRGRSSHGRGRGRFNSQDRNKGKKDRSYVICYRCDKAGHFSSMCPERKQRFQEANKIETEEADEALYTHEVVFLNEENIIPKKLETEKEGNGVWYLDNGASNHMTGVRSFFSELNENIKGRVKFGDGSCVNIGGKGSILFEAKTGEQRLLIDIYFIPDLKSNILSLGQATEYGCDVRMKGSHLTLRDPGGKLLVKVTRSPNRLYKINLKV